MELHAFSILYEVNIPLGAVACGVLAFEGVIVYSVRIRGELSTLRGELLVTKDSN